MKTYAPILLAAALIILLGGSVFSQNRVAVQTLPFSPARVAGNTLYVSGQIGVTPDGDPVLGSVADETRQCMQNIGRVLNDNGYTFADVVSVTVYLADMKDYNEMNAAYRTFFPDGAFPARACVGGLQIAFGFHTEISCIAYKD